MYCHSNGKYDTLAASGQHGTETTRTFIIYMPVSDCVFYKDCGNVTRLNHVIDIRNGRRHISSKPGDKGTIFVP